MLPRQKDKASFLHLDDLSRASPFYQSSTVSLKELANRAANQRHGAGSTLMLNGSGTPGLGTPGVGTPLGSPLGGPSMVSSPQRSFTSLSHVRLDNLVREKQWDETEDFMLEELRDGYFDALFSQPEKEYRTMSSPEESGFENNTNVLKRLSKQVVHTSNNDLTVLRTRFIGDLWTNIIPVIKFSLCYFCAFVIVVIHPAGSWIGHRFRYFLPIAAVIHHPVRSVGVQLEMSVASIAGAAFGLGWSALAWYISTATAPTASHQGGILFQSLFMAILFATFMREIFRRLSYFFNSFSIAIIFTHTVDLVYSKHDMKWKLYWDFGISYLFGILLSGLICVLFFPQFGNSRLIEEYRISMLSCRDFLFSLIDKDNISDSNAKDKKQKDMITNLNVNLSQEYREFSNQLTFTKYDRNKLKKLRNSLTALVSPLRVIPVQSNLLDEAHLTHLFDLLTKTKEAGINTLANTTIHTGATTPFGNNLQGSSYFNQKSGLGSDFSQKDIYLSILRSTFSKEIFALLTEMIFIMESLADVLEDLEKKKKVSFEDKFLEWNSKLKRRIYKLDICYKNFTTSNYFTPEILKETDCVDSFLFLRYIRNSAKSLVTVMKACQELTEDIHWRLLPPKYPLHRALERLPRQCVLDEGAGNVLHYFETKKDVDEIFERLYNAYTSRHKYQKDESKEKVGVSLRAVDHSDFNFHTTKNKWRYNSWRFTTVISGNEMKWSLKILFIIIFLCLPTWLPESSNWYQEFQCWWAPLIFYMLAHRRYSGKWSSPVRRIGYAIIGIFWGWAANQARHFSSPYVLCAFAGILVVPISLNFLVYFNTKSSMTSLLCFAVVALEPYSKGEDNHNTRKIWKNTWITGLSLLIGIALSIPINWVVWSFKARVELRVSMASLLAHLSQSYQTVSDRYLYRDLNDEPTDLALALAHIREVRLTQSIFAIRELLNKAAVEPKFISNFSPAKYSKLIDSCSFLLEKVIEARISGTYFEIWEQDNDTDVSRALLSVRRDSVASVIFVFYILSNCFRSSNKIPRYLPNPILSRKKLYDLISKFEKMGKMKNIASVTTNNQVGGNKIDESLEKSLFKKQAPIEVEEEFDYEQYHWTEVHGIAFARAYTDVAEAVHEVIKCCKDILGEEFF